MVRKHISRQRINYKVKGLLEGNKIKQKIYILKYKSIITIYLYSSTNHA